VVSCRENQYSRSCINEQNCYAHKCRYETRLRDAGVFVPKGLSSIDNRKPIKPVAAGSRDAANVVAYWRYQCMPMETCNVSKLVQLNRMMDKETGKNIRGASMWLPEERRPSSQARHDLDGIDPGSCPDHESNDVLAPTDI